MLEFRVLGPFQVRRDGRVLDLAGAKARTLLALLLARANAHVSAERLIDGLWGERPPSGARKALQMQVSRVRQALRSGATDDAAEVLVSDPAGYRLLLEPEQLDAARCQALVDEGLRLLATGRPDRARPLLRDALAMWRGPALADLASESCLQADIARLEELRLTALEARVDADLALGRHTELAGELRQLVGEHPLRERFYHQLMLALYRAGRQADALETYRHARAVLVDELGIEPGRELRELHQAMLTQDLKLALEHRDAAGAERRMDEPSTARVPVPPTRTIGREAELERLGDVVLDPDARLVTVVGAAGVGKTRLAIELARAVGPRLGHGAAFVSLAPLAAHEHVASTVARDVGVTPAASEAVESALIRHLGLRKLLLVLDNFEHVLDAGPLVADLIAAAPELTVLATSREPLRLRGERLFHLDPLAVAPEESTREVAPAVALFVAVVQARDPAFTLSERNLPAITELCQRLDGLPLALELAAGRIGLMSVSELATRMRTGLDALDAAPRDAPSRHRTLNTTLEWSYALLDPEEQRVLDALSVFAGGCTLDAAQTVTGAALEVLEALVAKNLVLAETGDDGQRRIAMLETVRTFARGRLADGCDADAIARRHREYYLAFTERVEPELERTNSRALIAKLDHELENVRAVYAWALEHAPELALRLASATSTYWHLRGLHRESANALGAALALPREAAAIAVRAAALHHYAVRLTEAGTIEQAEKAARESLRLRQSLNDVSGCARSTSALAHVLLHAHRIPDSHRCAGEALRLADAAGDRQARVWALGTMAMTAPTLGDALTLGERAAAEHRSADNQHALAVLQSNLVYTALFHGEHAAAEPLSLKALAAADAYGNPLLRAFAEGNAGLATLFCGHTRAAQRAFISQLELVRGHGFHSEYPGLLFEAIDGLAAVAAARGHDNTAATLRGAAAGATHEQHDPVITSYLDERFFATARARLGAHAWQQAYAAGATLDRDHAIEAALQSVQLLAVA